MLSVCATLLSADLTRPILTGKLSLGEALLMSIQSGVKLVTLVYLKWLIEIFDELVDTVHT